MSAERRYYLGCTVRDVEDNRGRYGPYGLSLICETVNYEVSRKTLRGYAEVARALKPAEALALLDRKNCHGQPLTWSHLVVLATEVTGEQRAAYVELVVREAISGKELRKRIRSGPPVTPEPPTNPEDPGDLRLLPSSRPKPNGV
jgi:hypothetical protein